MKIEFEPTAFAIDEWWAGEIIIDIGDDLEYREEIYPFTLFVSSDNGVMEVTWTEKTPTKNIIDIETRIKQNYLAR
jgi:hypothetical protein